MSRVMNAILAAHVGRRPDDEIAVVNEFLRTNDVGGGEFREVTDHAGGHKHLKCRIYLAAFNHANTDNVVEAVRHAPWRDREMVQLFIKEQEEELFTLRYCGSPKSVMLSVDLTPEEITIIRNALNEVCHGVDLHGEFETRIGATMDEGRRLLARLLQVESSKS
jgi:hypothetical protein